MKPASDTMTDYVFMKRAIELALQAEKEGNLPIGAVITWENEVIAEGKNSMVIPEYIPSRHAEMNALDKVPATLWSRANQMTCYSTLEPCPMCFGRLLLSGIGRIIFGAYDPGGGAGCLINHLPGYFNQQNIPIWHGPLMPAECDALFQRSRTLFDQLRSGNLA